MVYLVIGLICALGATLSMLYYANKQKAYWRIIAFTLYDDLIILKEKEAGKDIGALNYKITLDDGSSMEFVIGSKPIDRPKEPTEFDLK